MTATDHQKDLYRFAKLCLRVEKQGAYSRKINATRLWNLADHNDSLCEQMWTVMTFVFPDRFRDGDVNAFRFAYRDN